MNTTQAPLQSMFVRATGLFTTAEILTLYMIYYIIIWYYIIILYVIFLYNIVI